MNLPSNEQLVAIGRHVVSYAMGGITVLSVTHLVTADQANQLGQSIDKISQGVALIATGLAPIIAIVSSIYASWAQSQKSHIAAVNQADNGLHVVASTVSAPTQVAPLKGPEAQPPVSPYSKGSLT
jgi:sulfite exporter TauE/SafE